MSVNKIVDVLSLRYFVDDFIQHPLECLEGMLNIICEEEQTSKYFEGSGDLLNVLWKSSSRSKESDAKETVKHISVAPFSIPSYLFDNTSYDLNSNCGGLYIQWSTSLLHLFAEKRYIDFAFSLFSEFRRIGLMSSQENMSSPYLRGRNITSTIESEEESESDIEVKIANAHVVDGYGWYGEASSIISEVSCQNVYK